MALTGLLLRSIGMEEVVFVVHFLRSGLVWQKDQTRDD